jgi:hypothetical protein
MRSRRAFTLQYEGAKSKHPELVTLSQQELDSFEERTANHQKRFESTFFVIGAVSLSVASLLITVGLVISIGFVGSVSTRLAGYDYAQPIGSVPGLTVGLLMGILVAFCYFVIFPTLGGGMYSGVDWRNKRFTIPALVVIYLLFGATTLFIALLFQSNRRLLEVLFYIWLIPLGILVALVVPVGVPAVVVMLLEKFHSKQPTSEIQVTRQLLYLLEEWPRLINNSNGESKRDISRRIKTTSDSIRRLYFKTPSDQSEEWSAEQMQRAADNLLVCVSWLYVPQAGTSDAIRMRLITFANSFLTGRLHELPRNVLSEEDGFRSPRRRQRIMRTVSLTVAILTYLLVPIVIYFVFRNRMQQLAVPESFLILLYSLWIAVGLYAYLEQTSENGMTTILDLVKGIITK